MYTRRRIREAMRDKRYEYDYGLDMDLYDYDYDDYDDYDESSEGGGYKTYDAMSDQQYYHKYGGDIAE